MGRTAFEGIYIQYNMFTRASNTIFLACYDGLFNTKRSRWSTFNITEFNAV